MENLIEKVATDVSQVYATLAERIKAAADAADLLARTEQDLRWAKTHQIVAGVLGKNENEREANLRLALAEQYRSQESAERMDRACRAALEIARTEESALKMRLRLLEIENERATGATVNAAMPDLMQLLGGTNGSN